MADQAMIEAMARAMMADQSKRHYGHESSWDEQTDYHRNEWLAQAQAAYAIVSKNDPLEWLSGNPSLELSWGEIDNDLSECAWRVHRCHGGINDREWDLVSTGETPTEALSKASSTHTREQSDEG